MIQGYPLSIPKPHRTFLDSSIEVFRGDARIVGVAAGGSYLTDLMDEFSDLDLMIAVDPPHFEAVMADRRQIAGSLGKLLAAFTGEHVGEPRLLVCLYGEPTLLHVDLKFVSLPDVASRIEDPAVMWERENRLTAALGTANAKHPLPDVQWIEDRFWVWAHYAAAKVARGEIFEAIDGLSFLRTTVLGPLALLNSHARPTGVRKIESLASRYIHDLKATVATYDAKDCLRALGACIGLYRTLRTEMPTAEPRRQAEEAAVSYLAEIENQIKQ